MRNSVDLLKKYAQESSSARAKSRIITQTVQGLAGSLSVPTATSTIDTESSLTPDQTEDTLEEDDKFSTATASFSQSTLHPSSNKDEDDATKKGKVAAVMDGWNDSPRQQMTDQADKWNTANAS